MSGSPDFPGGFKPWICQRGLLVWHWAPSGDTRKSILKVLLPLAIWPLGHPHPTPHPQNSPCPCRGTSVGREMGLRKWDPLKQSLELCSKQWMRYSGDWLETNIIKHKLFLASLYGINPTLTPQGSKKQIQLAQAFWYIYIYIFLSKIKPSFLCAWFLQIVTKWVTLVKIFKSNTSLLEGLSQVFNKLLSSALWLPCLRVVKWEIYLFYLKQFY